MNVAILYNRPVADDQPNAEASQDVLAQVEHVEAALLELGHEPSRVEVWGDLRAELDALLRAEPEVVFNLVETVDEDPRLYPNAAAMLELLRLSFTGSGSAALMVTTDKHLAKLAFKGAGLPTPAWITYDRGSAFSNNVPRPWLVKPNLEDASIGIDDDSVFDDEARLAAALPKLWQTHGRKPLLVEHYVDGREFNMALLDNGRELEVLPAAEIDFAAFEPGKPRIVGYQAKWAEGSFEYEHTPRKFHRDDDPGIVALKTLAKDACKLVGMSGYARVDIRVAADGAPYILEVNANPCLSPDAGFMAAAEQAGLSAADAIGRILAAARRRR